MSSCIICGSSVDGRICDLHEEDVVFEFRGDRPDQLTVDRYYRGTVDGYAEFGVFVDVGDSVTGLLHRSELDQRLESLDWEPGDVVFVQVKQVRDNGNVDLGWSIRQSESEFRGVLIDDPSQGAPYLRDDDEHATEDGESTGSPSAPERDDSSTSAADSESERSSVQATEPDTPATNGAGASEGDDTSNHPDDRQGQAADRQESISAETSTTEQGEGGTATAASRGASTTVVEEPEEPTLVTIDSLEDHNGDIVQIEGVVETARQTSGPTIFEVRDETGTVECAAFEEAGVRAYPETGTDDVVRLDGEVRERRGEIQLETEALVRLDGDEETDVEQRLVDALEAEARPDEVEPLVADETIEQLAGSLRDAATAIRRAVIEERPVIVRHRASADGYVAGVALERATLPLIRDNHQQHDAEYHYFDRRPLDNGVYDMDDATNDVTSMLDARERHGEKVPLFVFVAAGATSESLDGFELLDLYGAGRVVVDEVSVDPDINEVVDTVVAPESRRADTTASTLAANVAAHVNEDVGDDLMHLPAVSFWEGAPDDYVDAAANAGYGQDAISELREAVALEAFYQSYEDKRELITDLLFTDENGRGLASHVSEQFRKKLDAEIQTAEANLDHQTVDDVRVAVLDTNAYTHRYEFPPVDLLLDELHRRHREDTPALVGVDEDELYVRTDTPVDVRDVADRAGEWAEDAGVSVQSARDGSIEFLAGKRSAVLDVVVDVLADEL